MASWFQIPKASQFSLANIPFGIISNTALSKPQAAIAIGDHVLALGVFSANGGFSGLSSAPPASVFSQPTLNAFAALGQPVHRKVRSYIQSIFATDTPYPQILKDNTSLQQKCLFALKDVKNHLPMQIGDYTDFYAGLNHAFNVGVLFRGVDNALQPNYTHLPVGYHGRASTVVVSGTPIRRPWGQILPSPTGPKIPVLSPCKKLDIELELAAFLCKSNNMGEPVSIDDAKEAIFGYVLMNDWSARDIQAWEYVPLGPFGSKNFGTTVSPWIVLVDALEPFLVKKMDAPAKAEGEVLEYLREKEESVFDMKLEVDLTSKSGKTTTITKTNAKNLLWSFPQMVAHHTVTGCAMAVGDLLGSGTISGTEPGSQGSILEQTKSGKTPIKLEGGEERTFLEDGDTVNIRGWSVGQDGARVGFGDCLGTIVASPTHLVSK